MNKLIICPECGHTNRPHYESCVKCGVSLEDAYLIERQKMSFWKVALKCFLWMALYLGLQIVAALILTPMFMSSVDFTESIELELARVLPNAVLMSVIVSGIVFMGIYWLRTRKLDQDNQRVRNFPINRKILLYSLLLGIAMVFVSNLIVTLIEPIVLMFNVDVLESMELISKIIEGTSVPLAIISVGIIGPIVEEVLFRGIVFYYLQKRYRIKTALIVQAVLFGAFHMNLAQASYAIVIGLILGLAYIYTQSLWVPIIMHVTNNLVAILMADVIGQFKGIALMVVALAMLAFIIIVLRIMKKDSIEFLPL